MTLDPNHFHMGSSPLYVTGTRTRTVLHFDWGYLLDMTDALTNGQLSVRECSGVTGRNRFNALIMTVANRNHQR